MTANLRGTDLNLLTVFHAVAQSGKLSEAANRLGMTQPAVSNAVARLRLIFRDELFVRGQCGVSLTPLARSLRNPVRETLERIQHLLVARDHFDPDLSERTFHLACGEYGERFLLPLILEEFLKYKGKLTLINTPESKPGQYSGSSDMQKDFWFDYKKPLSRQFECCELVSDKIVVISRKNHPKIRKNLSIQQYLSSVHVILTFRNQGMTMLEDILPGKVTIPRKIVAEVQQLGSLPDFVVRSDCLATVSERMAQEFSRKFPINIHPFPFYKQLNQFFMVWHTSMNQDMGHRWLKELIIRLAGSF